MRDKYSSLQTPPSTHQLLQKDVQYLYSSLVALHVEQFDVLWFLKVFFKHALKILTYLHRSTSPQRGLSL